MKTIDFFTAANFGDNSKSYTQAALEKVDNYFYLHGKKAYVIPGQAQQGSEGVVLAEDSPALFSTVLKVISYLTVIIPVILLIAKVILRSIHKFHIIDAKQEIGVSQATIEKIQITQPFYPVNDSLDTTRKLIQVDDLNTLDLNLDEQGYLRIPELREDVSDEESSGEYIHQRVEYRHQPITLREAVIDVITKINDAITNAPENASTKGKREILLNTNKGTLQDYHRLGLPDNQFCITEEEEQKIWLRQIIHALVAKGHLFKLAAVNGHGYFIQI